MNAPSRQAAAKARRASLQRVPAPIGRERRGVLLLIVLSMLTLFMMLGAAYLVVATRSRETARAYAKLSLRNDNVRLPHSQIFDTVMLRVLRGVPAGQIVNVDLAQPAPPGVAIATSFESLLTDKYGGEIDASGNSFVLSGTAWQRGNQNPAPVYEQPPVLVLPQVNLDKLPADKDGYAFATTDLAGRVITILGTGRDPSSHRILQATDNGDGSYKLVVDNQPRNRPYEPVAGQSCRVVINGREFSGSGTASQPNESWDGFDDFNPFLAWVAPRDLQNETDATKVSVSSSVVKKVGFVQSGTAAHVLSLLNSGTNGFSYGADNDNDGVNDGFFLDFGLPTVISPNGDQVTLHASVLVLDLDGRVNVNAHGSLVPIVYPHSAMSGTNTNWQLGNLPTGFTTAKLLPFPTGSGYGPPEVNLDLLFPYASSPAPTYSTERLQGTVTRGYPEENPLLYLRTGVSQGRLQVGRAPQGGRFYSRDSAGSLTSTPQLPPSEGRYGGNPPLNFAPTSLMSPNAQIAAKLPSRFSPPGNPWVNDPVSAITDHRSPIDPATLTASPRTLGFDGVPPLWWNTDDKDTFNWANKTTPFTGSPDLYPRSTYNSPPDLQGRMKTFTVGAKASTGIAPQLCFVKPEWSRNGNLDVETRDDPYELRLDTRAPRNSWLRSYGAASPRGNIFNLSELENILRPYDIDSSKLPPRLEAILGSVAEEARLRITTDSWDSTVVSGSAAPKLFDWARKLSDTLGGDAAKLYGATTASNKAVLDGVLNREIARGERFDLNRPLTGTKPAKYDIADPYYAQRQAYFKDLYVLLCALTPPADFNARNCAQWVANIVEFRDGDSTMTPFEFDTNPADGWDVDGNVRTTNDDKPAQRDVVFGCERPEIVIAETCAWEDATTGELYVVLHRPWNATAFGKAASGDALIAAEPCDPQLDSYDMTKKNPLNALDLGRKSGATAANPANNANPADRATLPVWRLRIHTDDPPNTPDTYIRLDTRTAAGGQPEHVLADNTTPKLGVDTSVCLKPQAASSVVTVVQQQQKLNVANFATLKVQGPAPAFGAVDRRATIFLERLTDPTSAPELTRPDWTQDPGNIAPSALTDSDGQLTRMAVYRVVDQQTVNVVNRTPEPVTMQVPPTKNPKTTRRVMDAPVDTFWKQATAETTAAVPLRIDANWTLDPNKPPKWFFWPNRPFIASPELLFVHALDSQSLLTKYSDPSPLLAPDADTNNWTWGPTVLRNLKSPPLFDAVHVPTRFAGIHGTTSDPNGNLATLAGIDQVTTPVNQLSAFREPGRVNLNTVTADDVWSAVVAGPLVKPDGSPDPIGTRSQAALNGIPARNTSSLLALTGQQPAGNDPQSMPKADGIATGNATLKPAIDLNPSQAIYTANRLANTATTKSHLFGVWITLREAMAPAPAAGQPVVPADPDGVRYHRAFYVIDRSIPVAHEPGRDHNVWDAVLLRRIVE